jgi:hypothetical protein
VKENEREEEKEEKKMRRRGVTCNVGWWAVG